MNIDRKNTKKSFCDKCLVRIVDQRNTEKDFYLCVRFILFQVSNLENG